MSPASWYCSMLTSGDAELRDSSYTTLGKLLEMFSEIASSHVTYFWFITCSVRLPVVMLLIFGLLHVQ